MKHQLSAVIIGQCAFICLVVRECIQQGVRFKRVVIWNKNADADPFRDLKCTAVPQWLVEHRFYHGGWRATLANECGKARIEYVSTNDIFANIPEADVLLVAGLAAKVPDRVLHRYGDYALNVHTSLLPRYRGPQPEAQVILHAESESGVSIHTMSSDFDNGPLRWQDRFSVQPDATVAQLERIEAGLAANGISAVLNGTTPPRTRRTVAAKNSYFPAYAAETLLNLAACDDVQKADRLIRLRPEHYAFIPTDAGRLWIVNANGTGCKEGIAVRIGAARLFVHQWVEDSGSAPLAYRQCGCNPHS